MLISDFDYELPAERIAQEPADPRDASRMMVLDAVQNRITDARFRDLPNFLLSNDILVLNDTRVLRARTVGKLERQGGSSRKIEVFFVEPTQAHVWQVLCRPGRRIRPGDRVVFGDDGASGIFRSVGEAGLHLLEFVSAEAVTNILERHGQIP